MNHREKAKESLKSARILLEAECYDSCASRCYYAMFQTAVAALRRMGIHPPRKDYHSHVWVQSTVSREMIHRRKILPSDFAEALPATLQLREKADYSETALGKKQVERMLKRCQEFIDYLQREVLKDGQEEG